MKTESRKLEPFLCLVCDVKWNLSVIHTGNVSLVSRLILDAGLTAELVKIWRDQPV